MSWLNVILICVAAAISQCYAEPVQDANFIAHLFHTLPSPKFIRVLRVKRNLECASSCLQTEKCCSFNIATEKEAHGYVCQLISTGRDNLQRVPSQAFHHYDRLDLQAPCDSSPCQNGGKCDVIASGRDFSCFCPPSFKGKYCQTANWIKISPQCFGARNSSFSSFTIQQPGVILTLKLAHVNGTITCDTGNAKGANYWGCRGLDGNHLYMSVIITDAGDKLVLPESRYFFSKSNKVYNFPGGNVVSPELVFPKLTAPLSVANGQVYRIWFGQDLENNSEADNGGTVCADVYGLYE